VYRCYLADFFISKPVYEKYQHIVGFAFIISTNDQVHAASPISELKNNGQQGDISSDGMGKVMVEALVKPAVI
jgi:hypothetical protein